MTDNELLLAMSDMMDTKLRAELQPLKNEIQDMRGEMQELRSEVRNEIHQLKLFQENIILPRLETIESCYLDTFHRYRDNADRMEAVYEDVDIMKKVLAEHSNQLQKLA